MGGRRRRLDEAERQALVEQLTAAWCCQYGSGAAPRIVEATDRQGRTIHASVIWEGWVGVSTEERAEIIVEALRQARGDESVAGLQAAIGLTPAEAGRRGR